MRHTLLIASATALLALGACKKASDEKQADPTAGQDTVMVPDETMPDAGDTAPALATSDWVGKWVGVEGMYVAITSTGAGKFKLEMQSDLDTKGVYEGTDVDEGIEFKRGNETLMLKRGNGDATGLKWLAGKKDCLIVKSGEGYCRD